MLTGKTESGFEFEIEEKTLDDYEFIEAVGKCEQGDPLAYVKVVDAALGSKKEKDRARRRLLLKIGQLVHLFGWYYIRTGKRR